MQWTEFLAQNLGWLKGPILYFGAGVGVRKMNKGLAFLFHISTWILIGSLNRLRQLPVVC